MMSETRTATRQNRRLVIGVALAMAGLSGSLFVLGRLLERTPACGADADRRSGGGAASAAGARGCVVRFGDGWYEWEQLGPINFRWAGASAELVLWLEEPATVRLSGEILTALRPNTISIGSPGDTPAGGAARITIDSTEWKFHPWGEVALWLAAGEHRLRFDSVRGATRAAPDPRLLGFALGDLTVRTQTRACVVAQ